MNPCITTSLALEAGDFAALSGGDWEPAWQIVCWAREFLCKPHPDLGREGPVCPWVKKSMDKGLFSLSVFRGNLNDPDAVTETLLLYREIFLTTIPREANEALFKTLLILFPEISQNDAPVLIDGVQNKMKGDFVSQKLMLGEFHQATMQTGLHNIEFHPLRAPIPMLVIRHMVVWDFPFLKDNRDYLASYMNTFGAEIPEKLLDCVQEATQRLDIPFPPKSG